MSEPPGMYKCMGPYKCTGVVQMYGASRCLPSIKHMPATKKSWKNPFKAKFLHLGWKMIREPPNCTGNEPTPDIPIGCSEQDIKKEQMANTCHL